MQDDEAMLREAQAMLRRLVQQRLELGAEGFQAVADQMGLPPEVVNVVEQVAGQVNDVQNRPASPLSGLVSASGQPLSSTPSGLLGPDGRPIRSSATGPGSGNGAVEGADADLESLLTEGDQEAQAQQMFQELLGVRLVIGEANFAVLTDRMGMDAEAAQAIAQTAGDIEQEIADRYPDENEANTIRLLNARMMMGEERFAELADQVGMPQDMRDGLEDLANQIEAQQGDEDDEDDEDDDDDGEPELQA